MRMLASLLLLASVGACNPSPKVTQDAPTTPTSVSTGPSASTSTSTSAMTAASASEADAAQPESGVRIVVAAQDGDALSLIRTERLRAKAEGRVLVVYAGAEWCAPCKRFKNVVRAGSLDEKLPKTTLLVFDADRDTDRLAAAGYRVEFIPYAALPGADGHPTDTVEARAKGSESWRVLIAKLEVWQAKGP